METEKQKVTVKQKRKQIPIWGKCILVLVAAIIVAAIWVFAAFLTVRGALHLKEYGQAKAEQVRSLILVKLDASPSVVISEPQSQQSIDQIVEAVAVSKKINPALIRALITVESNWRQDAIGFNSALEPKYGKMVAADHGLCQVSGRWANSELCPDVKVWSDLYDAKKNIECGAAILKDALANSKTVTGGLSVYNTGRVGTERGIQYASKISMELVNSMRLQ